MIFILIIFILAIYIFSVLNDVEKPGSGTFTDAFQFITGNSRLDFYLTMLSGEVMKADGYIKKAALSVFKQFFIHNFGEYKTKMALHNLKGLINNNIDITTYSRELVFILDYSGRLQLLQFLYKLASADGQISDNEDNILSNIANLLEINEKGKETIKQLFVAYYQSNTRNQQYSGQNYNEYKPQFSQWSLAENYHLLGVAPDCSISELKKAYRDSAKKYHPDKFEHVGTPEKLKAQEKFREINQAYDRIMKSRGQK